MMMKKEILEMYQVTMYLSHSLSLIILVLIFILPAGFSGVGWSLLVLFQLVGTFSSHKLYQHQKPDLKKIYEYLKNTKL